MEKRNRSWLCLPLLLLLWACDSKPMFEESRSISSERWGKNDIVRFDLPVSDTATFYDLYINLRNINTYPYSNIFLFVKVHAPNGMTVTDTLEYSLADSYGQWLGKSSSRLWDTKLPFRSMVKFAQQGDYTFEIQQGMRDDELEGIIDVGLMVEKTPEN